MYSYSYALSILLAFLLLNILPPILNPLDVTLDILTIVKNGVYNLEKFHIFKESKQNLHMNGT
jgi:hypothetical protein